MPPNVVLIKLCPLSLSPVACNECESEGEYNYYINSIFVPEQFIYPLSTDKHLTDNFPPINDMENNDKILEKYLRESNQTNKKSSIKCDYQIIKKLLQHIKKPFKQITSDDILEYFQKIQNGTIKTRLGKPYNSYTTEQHKTQVRKFFKYLYNWEEGQSLPEPVRKLKINLSRSYEWKDLSEIPTIEEILLLIQACDKTSNPFVAIRDKAIIYVTYESGCRLGEIHGLRIGNVIDMDGNIGIAVDGKTGKRQCFLFKSAKYLKEYLFVHPEKDNPSAPLWINRFGDKFSYAGMQQQFERILKKSDLKKHISFHFLRHARASYVTEKGMNDDEKRLMFGWARTSSIPARYTHITNETVRKKLISIEGQKQYVDEKEVEKRVEERLQQEKQKIQDEILQNLLQTLKDPQHHAIQDFLYEQSEKS